MHPITSQKTPACADGSTAGLGGQEGTQSAASLPSAVLITWCCSAPVTEVSLSAVSRSHRVPVVLNAPSSTLLLFEKSSSSSPKCSLYLRAKMNLSCRGNVCDSVSVPWDFGAGAAVGQCWGWAARGGSRCCSDTCVAQLLLWVAELLTA